MVGTASSYHNYPPDTNVIQGRVPELFPHQERDIRPSPQGKTPPSEVKRNRREFTPPLYTGVTIRDPKTKRIISVPHRGYAPVGKGLYGSGHNACEARVNKLIQITEELT